MSSLPLFFRVSRQTREVCCSGSHRALRNVSRHRNLAAGGRMLSYVHGTGAVALKGETIGAALEAAARVHGAATALVSRHQNIRWSYEELNARADALAAGLLAMGLRPR